MPRRPPSHRGNPALSLLRAVLWTLPAFLIIVGFILFAWLASFLPDGIAFGITLPLLVTLTAGLGCFDRSIYYHRRNEHPIQTRSEILGSIAVFILIQLALAPILLGGWLMLAAWIMGSLL